MSNFTPSSPLGTVAPPVADIVFRGLTAQIHKRFVADSDVAAVSRLSRDDLVIPVTELVSTWLGAQRIPLAARQRESLVAAVISEISGYGPLDQLLSDPAITEIMVNSPDDVYVEIEGTIHRTDVTFDDDLHIRRVMEKIVAPLGRRIDDASPMVDARLPDGSRANCIIPPLAVRGPVLTIRKFSPVPYVAEDLVRFGTLTRPMAEFLKACVASRLNIVVSGGTGSGKTTLLNTLSSFIPANQRIVTIEDAAELRLQQEHVVALESRPANLEGVGEITIRHLVRNALRMRPDRIILGEVRGQETLDLLMALNTGHDGSLTTIHANSPRDSLSRLETMALMAGTELPLRAVREQVASALQIVVHISRRPDGRRRVTHVTELHGMSGDVIVTQDIFGVNSQGDVRSSGLRPLVLEIMADRGFCVAWEPEQ